MDPALALHRRRTLTAGHLEERFEVTDAGGRPVRFRLTITAGTDLATMAPVAVSPALPRAAWPQVRSRPEDLVRAWH